MQRTDVDRVGREEIEIYLDGKVSVCRCSQREVGPAELEDFSLFPSAGKAIRSRSCRI